MISLLLCSLAQEAQAQYILLVQSTVRFKNYKYFVGDDIIIKATGSRGRIKGTLEGMTDSSIYIDLDKEVMIKDIEKIYRHRYWFGLLTPVTAIAGAGYLGLEVTNNLLTGNPTIVSNNTLFISSGLLAFSAALIPFHYRGLRIDKRWQVLVLYMGMDYDVPNPFQR